ncbi:MAG: GreA/GreB family elongation factor [Sporocytophaga sp.]|nr:GreA/GreB family elongation factor [Sporocytophaga sp.]
MKKEIILSKQDYDLITSLIKNSPSDFSQYSLKKLSTELRSAKVVDGESLPVDVIRVNSEVEIFDEKEKKSMTFKLVPPSFSNLKENKLSIIAPLGSALIGYRKGDLVEWEVPAGKKVFKIKEVKNS